MSLAGNFSFVCASELKTEIPRRDFKEEANLDMHIGNLIGGRIEDPFDRTKIILCLWKAFLLKE